MLEVGVEGEPVLAGELLVEEAPESVAALRGMLPHESDLLHVRWSGHAVWINIDEVDLPEIPRENHTVYPSRGYRNEQEILLACGPTCFRSPAGELAGNHVATMDADRERLRALEERTLQEGALSVTVREG
jgi:hypothetical protein